MKDNQHQEIISTIDKQLVITERLMGGMSNYTYLCAKKNKKYVFRIPGEGGHNFVNYDIEAENLEAIKSLDINTKTIFHDSTTGYKISEYIEGVMVDEHIDLNLVVKTLKKLHEHQTMFNNNYNHLERLSSYEVLHHNNNKEYDILKNDFIKIYNNYLKQHIDTPCHNDAQIANMIIDENQKVHLLDWEFSGNNDKIYDIASFGNKDFNQAVSLLNVYFDNPTNNHFLRLYAWRMFQCLQWFNVASYKHEIGLGDKLNVPFDKVADNYIALAQKMYESAQTFYDIND